MIFFDKYCDPFYTRLGLNYGSTFEFGQIYWTPAYYPHENVQFFRPVFDPTDKTKTSADRFVIEPSGKDAFNRGFPLEKPKLGVHEEFLVVRAKRRPVVLLQAESHTLDKLNKGFGRMKLQRHLCTVAQGFGLANARGDTRCDLALLDRIRALEFPQLMYLPKHSGLFDMDGLLKLDEMQSVFTGNLEATQYRLSDEAIDVLKDEVRFLLTGVTSPRHDELREFLLKENL